MRWTREVPHDERRIGGRPSRVVPIPRRWGQACGWRVRRRWRLSSPALQGEHEAAVKTIAQGMPVVPAEPVVTAACFFCCRRAMGAACIRHSLRPLIFRRAMYDASLGHERAAGIWKHVSNTVIASAAKQSIFPRVETWIASLRSQW